MRSIVLASLVAVTGCIGDEELDGEGIDVDGKADGSPVELAPTYALELTSTMTMEDRRESDPATRFTTLTMRARAQVKTTQTGDAVKLAVDLCDVRLPQVSGYQPELDPAFVISLPALQVNADIERATDGAVSLASQTFPLVLGAQLANPASDRLPQAGSARIKDQDQDGNPGVSISIPGYGKIFAALRVSFDFTAGLGNVAAINGEANVGLDQKLYGDNIWFYDAVSSAAETEANVSLVSATNRVKMKRDATTCAKVKQLFP